MNKKKYVHFDETAIKSLPNSVHKFISSQFISEKNQY